MPKTETITIRVSPEDKRLISNLAWVQRISVSDALTFLARQEMRKLKESGYPMPSEETMNLMYKGKVKGDK